MRLVLFLGLIALASTSISQNYHGYFEQIDERQGLPHLNIKDIHQDDNGFLWLASEIGLVKYDGYQFRTYNEINNNISISDIQQIIPDKNGNLWLRSFNHGLAVFNKKTREFQLFNENSDTLKLVSNIVEHIFIDELNRLWICSRLGLQIVDLESGASSFFNKETHPTLPGNKIMMVQKWMGQYWISIHNIYVGKSGSAFGSFDPKTGIFRPCKEMIDLKGDFTTKRFFNFLPSDDKQCIWLASMHGISEINLIDSTIYNYAYRPFNNEIPDEIHAAAVTEMLQVGENLWLGTMEHGIYIFNTQTKKFDQNWKKDAGYNKISDNHITDIFKDQFNIIWVATHDGGLNKYDLNQKGFHDVARQFKNLNFDHKTVTSLFIDPAQNIWVGTESTGLYVLNPTEGTFDHIENISGDESTIGAGAIRAIDQTTDGTIWIACNKGIICSIDPGSLRVKRYRGGNWDLHGWAFTDLQVDAKDRVWVGSVSGGIEYKNPDQNIFRQFHFNAEDTTYRIFEQISVDFIDIDNTKNTMWIGAGAHLFKLNSTELSVSKLTASRQEIKQLPAKNYTFAFSDSNKKSWFGSKGHGLFCMDADQEFLANFKTDEKNGNYFYALEEDNNGQFWISTNNGISKFDPQSGNFVSYDQNDFRKLGQFRPNVSAKDQEGNLYFGGVHKLISFQPEKIKQNLIKPEMQISSVRVMPENLTQFTREFMNGSNMHSIDLPSGTKTIAISFAAIHFANPYKNRYEYKLIGFNERWHKSDHTKRQVAYNNLSPGNYTFKVRGTNNDGIWSNYKTLKIHIKPPFYQDWKFLIASGMTFLLILYGLSQWRTYSLRKNKSRLQKMIFERTSALKNANISLSKKNILIEEQLKEIIQKTRTLEEQSEEIKQMNENLEQRVRERTDQLFNQNQILREYAYMNAHHVRGPLCRIIGLVQLMEKDLNKNISQELFDYLKRETEDLNNIIEKVRDIIENGIIDQDENNI